MDHIKFKVTLASALLLGLPLVNSSVAFAAKPLDLSHQSPTLLESFISTPAIVGAGNASNVIETSRDVDANNTTHVRVQQMYAGFPVWGADAVMHLKNGAKQPNTMSSIAASTESMDGTFYQNVKTDLVKSPAQFDTPANAQKLLQQAIVNYQSDAGSKPAVSEEKTTMIVFVDDNNKAHWAYKINFTVAPAGKNSLPAKPVYIMDAETGVVYKHWNDIKTDAPTLFDVRGGGFGGNLKMGKVIYDGSLKNLGILNIKRDRAAHTCYLQNDDVTVVSSRNKMVSTFDCVKVDPTHNRVFFDSDLDAVNGGYSPDNDALFGGQVIKAMYSQWFNVPVLTTSAGKPMMLKMVVHAQMDNAYWDGKQMTFGDGVSMFYPLTSLGVAAHEISHGFTEQHSDLNYTGQSGGMNEAYSDMAAQAAEVYAYGKNSWQIGPEIVKAPDTALRYMDKPSKDCDGGTPGDECSIDNANQYNSGLDVHYSSGVYNRFFYLLASTKDWDVRKAFNLMLQANSHYWTSNSNFKTGACGVMRAAKAIKYNTTDVAAAFKKVGIPTTAC